MAPKHNLLIGWKRITTPYLRFVHLSVLEKFFACPFAVSEDSANDRPQRVKVDIMPIYSVPIISLPGLEYREVAPPRLYWQIFTILSDSYSRVGICLQGDYPIMKNI